MFIFIIYIFIIICKVCFNRYIIVCFNTLFKYDWIGWAIYFYKSFFDTFSIFFIYIFKSLETSFTVRFFHGFSNLLIASLISSCFNSSFKFYLLIDKKILCILFLLPFLLNFYSTNIR